MDVVSIPFFEVGLMSLSQSPAFYPFEAGNPGTPLQSSDDLFFLKKIFF
jgi:hypothetical protein